MKPTKLLKLAAIGSALLVASGYAAKGGGGGGVHGAGGAPGHGMGPAMSETPRSDDIPRGGEGRANGRYDRPSRGSDRDSSAENGRRSAKPAAQELAGSMHEINQTAFAQRRQLHETLDMRLKSSRDALKKIQADAKTARIDAREDFKAALADVKGREKDLDRELKAAKKAGENDWDARRMALAQAQQSHAEALARLESISRMPR